MKWQDHIVADKNVLLGKPIIKGTRISIELILELLESDWDEKKIIESYPALSQDSLKALYTFLREGVEMRFYPL